MKLKKVISLLLSAAIFVSATASLSASVGAESGEEVQHGSAAALTAEKPSASLTLGGSATLGLSNNIVGIDYTIPVVLGGEDAFDEGVIFESDFATVSLSNDEYNPALGDNYYENGKFVSGRSYSGKLHIEAKDGYYIGKNEPVDLFMETEDMILLNVSQRGVTAFTDDYIREIPDDFVFGEDRNDVLTSYDFRFDYCCFDKATDADGVLSAEYDEIDAAKIESVNLAFNPEFGLAGKRHRNYLFECESCYLLAYMYMPMELTSPDGTLNPINALDENGCYLRSDETKTADYIISYVVYPKDGFEFGTANYRGETVLGLSIFDGVSKPQTLTLNEEDSKSYNAEFVNVSSYVTSYEKSAVDYVGINLRSAQIKSACKFSDFKSAAVKYADDEEIDLPNGFSDEKEYDKMCGVYRTEYRFEGALTDGIYLAPSNTYKVTATVYPSYGVKFSENATVRAVTERGYLIPNSNITLNDDGTLTIVYYSETEKSSKKSSETMPITEITGGELIVNAPCANMNYEYYMDFLMSSVIGIRQDDGSLSETVSGDIYSINGEQRFSEDKKFISGEKVALLIYLYTEDGYAFAENPSFSFVDLSGNEITDITIGELSDDHTIMEVTINCTVLPAVPLSKLMLGEIAAAAGGSDNKFGDDNRYIQFFLPFIGTNEEIYQTLKNVFDKSSLFDCFFVNAFGYTKTSVSGLKYGERLINGEQYSFDVKSYTDFPFIIDSETEIITKSGDNVTITALRTDENGTLYYTVTTTPNSNAENLDRATYDRPVSPVSPAVPSKPVIPVIITTPTDAASDEPEPSDEENPTDEEKTTDGEAEVSITPENEVLPEPNPEPELDIEEDASLGTEDGSETNEGDEIGADNSENSNEAADFDKENDGSADVNPATGVSAAVIPLALSCIFAIAMKKKRK